MHEERRLIETDGPPNTMFNPFIQTRESAGEFEQGSGMSIDEEDKQPWPANQKDDLYYEQPTTPTGFKNIQSDSDSETEASNSDSEDSNSRPRLLTTP